MECVEVSGGRATVDLPDGDVFVLGAALNEAIEVLAAEEADYVERSGYSEHSFVFLHDWLVAHRPEQPTAKRVSFATQALVRVSAACEADKQLATWVSSGGAAPLVRVTFTVDALKIFDAAIRQTLEHFGADDPPFWELGIRAGADPETFQKVQQQIQRILAAVATAV